MMATQAYTQNFTEHSDVIPQEQALPYQSPNRGQSQPPPETDTLNLQELFQVQDDQRAASPVSQTPPDHPDPLWLTDHDTPSPIIQSSQMMTREQCDLAEITTQLLQER